MSIGRIAGLALAGAALLGAQAAFPAATAASAVTQTEIAAPSASLESGRYVGPQTITFTAQQGAEIRYTLDGTHPTRLSPVAAGPITVDKTANITAVAFTERGESLPTIRGILIKTAEEPLSQFAVMSDIHLSTGSGPSWDKWTGYFDTLKRIAPNPDAIISNGDQINDNNFNTATDHQYPRTMLEQNLARTGMTDTKIMMSFGNHDDRVNKMAEQYPDEWFPGETGYYESEIGGFPAFVVNTEAWNTTQANWLYGRLDALSKDPVTQGQPIFVFGHRPIPATVWDGAQSSNSGLKTNLSAFPQVVYFSGHSHLNITDERSIHQQDFTSVNEGSMSYEEIDGKFQAFGPGLAKNATVPTAQSVVVDVYADRIEIDRINYAADPGRTYTDDGTWSFLNNPPFKSSGSLAGPTWTIARGATPAETKAKFTYTQANRNKVSPVWSEQQPTVRQTDTGPVLRLPQAADDQFASEYTLVVRDTETGAITRLVPANGRIYSDYVVAPKPAVLDIPLAVRAGDAVGKPIDRTLEIGRSYEATLTAWDSYGNKSEPRTFTFVAGAIDRSKADAAAAAAEPTRERVERILGNTVPAESGDFDFALADSAAAGAASSALRELVEAVPATQDAADELAWSITDRAAELAAQLLPVDREALAEAIGAAETALDGRAKAAPATAEVTAAAAQRATAPTTGSPAAAEATLRSELAEARALQRTLNVQQQGLDTATSELRGALAAWQEATGPGTGPGVGATPGGTGVPGIGGSGSASGSLAESGALIGTGIGVLAAVAMAAGTWLLVARRARPGEAQ
ncbi:chitobiase/beta-hexosaminidase C-terminal domain-containing protein [Leucobacter albus]|uniref:Chitobiase/beta-hexosaminidase C-terminal domain-containing protein n=1 Tax=Leucobacter albus TaxID=272210 RepID=A0ABW3TNK2_9MICO